MTIHKLIIERVHGLDHASVYELLTPQSAKAMADDLFDDGFPLDGLHYHRMAQSRKLQWSICHHCHVNGLTDREYALYRNMTITKERKPQSALYCNY